MVGEQIRKLIDNQQVLTRNQIAIELGITENNLYKLYKKSTVNSKYLESLCKLFNVPMSYFFGQETVDDKKLSINVKNSTNENSSNPLIEAKDKLIAEKERMILEKEKQLAEKDKFISYIEKELERLRQRDDELHNKLIAFFETNKLGKLRGSERQATAIEKENPKALGEGKKDYLPTALKNNQ